MPSPLPLASRPDAGAAAPARTSPERVAADLRRAIAVPGAVAGVGLVLVATLAWPAPTPAGAAPWLRLTGLAALAAFVGAALAWSWRRASHLAALYADLHDTRLRDDVLASETEQRLAGIIASAMDAIITVDSTYRIVVYNELAERTFGWRAEEILGQPLDRLIPARFREAHAEHVRSFAATGASTRTMGRPGQLVGLRRDGTQFAIEATISKVVVGGERLLTVILRDVSERQRAEEERARQSLRLERYARRLEGMQEIDRAILASRRLDDLLVGALLRLAPLLRSDEVAVAILRENGDTVQHRVVPAGSPQASVVVHPAGTEQAVDDWIAGSGGTVVVDDLSMPRAEVPPSVRRGRPTPYGSYVATTLGGRGGREPLGRLECWSHATGTFDREACDTVMEVADVLAIAVEQGQLRDDLRRHAQDLEARVEQRTRALQDVNAELNAFAYSVSHDLRAPLRSMQGFAEALLEDYGSALDEMGQDYARRIVAASRRMDDLIQDLLAYSRLSRADVELQPVDLAAVVEGAATLAVEQAAARALPALPCIDVEHPLPPVVGHAGVLGRILQNLVGNAVKFVEPGTVPHVRISATSCNGLVRLAIQDNGIGVPAEYQERIFRVFERLHPLEAYPGTGIGLAIVRKGAERLGGRCGVESTPGQGSRFWVELPAADGPATATIASGPPSREP